METTDMINLSPGKIIIDDGLLSKCGEIARKVVCDAKNATLVTDDTVDGLYGDIAENSLRSAGFNVFRFIIKHGEQSKNATNLLALLEFMAEKGISRSDIAVALGGGVVGDITGLAASLYMRGIGLIHVPTTLLSMVDSSIGGKTAINLSAGKNLVGSFHAPDAVISDIAMLQTLPPETFADGCAEVIKYALLNGKTMLMSLEKAPIADLDMKKIVSECVVSKLDIVTKDERDNGLRQMLNLGHTAGHAIEKASGYTITHGSAVAVGMLIIAEGTESIETAGILRPILEKNGLPTYVSLSPKAIAEALAIDKKRRGDMISLVVPYHPGDCQLEKVTIDDAKKIIIKGSIKCSRK